MRAAEFSTITFIAKNENRVSIVFWQISTKELKFGNFNKCRPTD